MKFIYKLCAIFTLFILAYSYPAQAQSPLISPGSSNSILISTGMYDVFNQGDKALELRVDYRYADPLFWQLKPWFGGELTTDESFWLGSGFYTEHKLNEQLLFIPSFGVGYYDKGDSELDLDHHIEFRSQLELAYEFNSGNRTGIYISHTSNAKLGNDNPGVEALGLYYQVPLNRLFK